MANETSTAARSQGYAFYKDVVQQARNGAVFLFADVQKHSASVFDDMYSAVKGSVERLDIGPTDDIRAQVMLLRKA